MAHSHSFGRASVIRKEKKAKVGHPLTNTELICVGLALFHEAGVNPQSHQVRKFVYLQKFGDMEEWGSTWYSDYFRRDGWLVGAHANAAELYTYAEKGRKWNLTSLGWKVARESLRKLDARTNARIGITTLQGKK